MQRLIRNSSFTILIWVVLFMLPLTSYSQKLYFKKTNIIDKELGIIINDFTQDKNGFLWLATNEGLIQSDGEELLRSHFSDSSLTEAIRCLYYKNDLLYLGSETGYLSIFSIKNNTSTKRIKISPSPINSLCIDDNNIIWVATEDNGIYTLDSDEINLIDINFDLADNTVNDLLYDQKRRAIWAATDRGISLCTITNKKLKIKNFGSNDGLLDNLITKIEQDNEGSIWLGSYSGKLFLIDSLDQIQNIDLAPWRTDKIIDLKLNNNSIWIACEENGIGEVNTSDLKLGSYDQNELISGIKGIQFVNENHLLINSSENEFLIADKNIQIYTQENGLEINKLSLVYTDKNGLLYFANDQGIYQKEKDNKFQLLVDLKKEGIEYVISLLIDSKGVIWFGTFDQGLYSYKDGNLKQYLENEGLINNNIMTLHEWDKAIWCGTLGGLCRIDQNEDEIVFTNYSKEQGLDAAYIYQLYSSEKLLYIATDGEGLIQFDKKQFKTIHTQLYESVYDITGLGDDHLFLSVENGRIIELENGVKKKVFSIINKDRPIDISGICQLNASKLIFVWEKGIGILNINNGRYQLFGSSSGLNDFSYDFLNILSNDKEGNTWIGTQKYLVKLESSILDIPLAPLSLIRAVELFSTPLDTQFHHFNFDENHFTFQLSSIWYQDPKIVQHQYRLIGLNEEWQTTKDKTIVFPKLESGDYKFEFRSGFNESITDAKIVSYSFRISKVFYSTWWFFTLSIILFLIGIYGLIKYRDRKTIQSKKLEYERVLSQFELLKSQINPHFLFNSLNTAYALIAKNEEEARNYLLSLSNYLRAILTKNQEHVISLTKELKFAKNYTLLQKKRFGDNLIFEINIEDERVLESYIPPLTLQILLENAIKHNIISKTNPLITKIFIEGDFLHIENNLQLKKGSGEGTKIGLSNIKSRYKILFDKEIIITSNDQSFVVKLPIIYKYVESFTD